MLTIGVIGTGKLGLCFALHAAEMGFKVTAMDNRKDYVDALNEGTFRTNEFGVNDRLEQRKVRFTTNIEETAVCSEATFVFVPTPTRVTDPGYDHKYVDAVIDALPYVTTERDLIIGCTTMPGYVASIADKARAHGFAVSYHPEFIAQGAILHGLQSPDMMLLGETTMESGDRVSAILGMLAPAPIFRMESTAAEIVKMAINSFLTMKIAFANAIGDLLIAHGLDPRIPLAAIGSDHRIGNRFLMYGFGYGGPCLPRDNRALSFAAHSVGLKTPLAAAADTANEMHAYEQAKILEDGGTLTFHGVSYKPEVDSIEESQQLRVASILASKGHEVILRDRTAVLDLVRNIYGDSRFKLEPTD